MQLLLADSRVMITAIITAVIVGVIVLSAKVHVKTAAQSAGAIRLIKKSQVLLPGLV